MRVSPFTEGLLAPLRTVLSPGTVFRRIRMYTARYGVFFTALFYFAAWVGAAVTTFLFTWLLLGLRSLLVEHSIRGLLAAPLLAALYSFAAPIVFAGLDTLLIALVAAFSPRDRPLYTVFLVRASSMLPYTLRVAVLAWRGSLSLTSLVAVEPDPVSLAFTLAGFLLTAYGLRRSMGMPWPSSLVAAALPLSYKLLPLLKH